MQTLPDDGTPEQQQRQSLVYEFMRGADNDAAAERAPRSDLRSSQSNHQYSSILKFNVAPEAWRFVTYVFFWSMCIFAIVITKTVVEDKLAKGPEIAGQTCGPFEAGVGFDLKTESHVARSFGYNNICEFLF